MSKLPKPVERTLHDIDSMGILSYPMRLPGVNNQLDLSSKVLESRIKLIGLGDRHPQIPFAMDDQNRSLNLGSIRDRRILPVDFGIFVWRFYEITEGKGRFIRKRILGS